MTHLTATEAGHKAGLAVAAGELTADEAAIFSQLWDAEAKHHGVAFRAAFLESYTDPAAYMASCSDTEEQ